MTTNVTVLYDSLCPVCRREVRLLSHFNRRGVLRLIDITAASFKPSEFGLTIEECIGSLRGFDAAGRPLEGMETIRAMYSAVGLGWVMIWTKLPLVSPVCNAGYRLFAHWRPRFSRFDPASCDESRCLPKKTK